MPVIFVGFIAARLGVPQPTTPPRAAAGSSTALMLKMPILGPILRKIAVARFCRTLSTLMTSGVPILDGLDITARTVGQRHHRGRHP